MGKSRLALSRTASADEVAEYLTSLAHGLKRGELSLGSGESTLRFVPIARVGVELQVKDKGKKGKIELGIGWEQRTKTEVTVLLASVASPAVRADESGQTRTQPSAPATRPARTGSILVIEDEEHLRGTLLDILAAAGHAVEAAADGLEGLARFQRGAFDVVVVAVSMPECSGLDVARAVKEMSPTTPIVMIAGWGDVMSPEQMGGAGIDFVLDKPFKTGRVLSVLADALALRHSG